MPLAHCCPALPHAVLCCVQSVATFAAVGPTKNGKSVYQNCVDAVKSGWFTKSQVSKQLNRASDTWWPGDCE